MAAEEGKFDIAQSPTPSIRTGCVAIRTGLATVDARTRRTT